MIALGLVQELQSRLDALWRVRVVRSQFLCQVLQVKFKVAIVLVVVVVLWAFAASNGWVGLLLGVLLGAWTVQRHQKGQRSLLSVALNQRHGIVTTSATVMIALALAAQGAAVLVVTRERESQRDRGREFAIQVNKEAERHRQAVVEKQRLELLQALPSKITAWREKLTEASRVSGKAPAGLADAIQVTSKVTRGIDEVIATLEAPTPELAAVQDECRRQAMLLDARFKAQKSATDVVEYVALGKSSIKRREFLYANECFDSALKILAEIRRQGETLIKHIPKGLNIEAKQVEINKLKASIEASVAKDQVRQEREEWSRKKRDERAGAQVGKTTDVDICTEKGTNYFREIGSYPILAMPPNAGRKAEDVARERCERTTGAFDLN